MIDNISTNAVGKVDKSVGLWSVFGVSVWVTTSNAGVVFFSFFFKCWCSWVNSDVLQRDSFTADVLLCPRRVLSTRWLHFRAARTWRNDAERRWTMLKDAVSIRVTDVVVSWPKPRPLTPLFRQSHVGLLTSRSFQWSIHRLNLIISYYSIILIIMYI